AAGAGRRTGAGHPAEAAGADAAAPTDGDPADGRFHWVAPARHPGHGTGNGADPAGERAANGGGTRDPPAVPGKGAVATPDGADRRKPGAHRRTTTRRP